MFHSPPEEAGRANFEQTVDWGNGRAVAGANESEILKMIESLPKS